MHWNRKNQDSVMITPLLVVWCLALLLAPTLSVAAGNHIDWQVVASAGPDSAQAPVSERAHLKRRRFKLKRGSLFALSTEPLRRQQKDCSNCHY